jgi:acyl-CoA thioesterase
MTNTFLRGLDIDHRWVGYQGLFGGFVVGLLVDVATSASTYRLVSLSANFISSVAHGDLEVTVEHLHVGRSTQVTRLAVRQNDRVCIHASAEFVRESIEGESRREPWVQSHPVIAPPAKSINQGRLDLPFDDLFDVRRIDSPRIHEPTSNWVRLRPAIEAPPGLRSPEALLAVFLDLPTPGLFGEPRPPAFIPTIDYTLHFPPRFRWEVSDWIHIVHSTAWATHNDCADDVKAWDASGNLVALGRQTRGVRWADS